MGLELNNDYSSFSFGDGKMIDGKWMINTILESLKSKATAGVTTNERNAPILFGIGGILF